MCNAVIESQIDQAIGWLWDDLWYMTRYDHDEMSIALTVDDLIHLENLTKGKIGYDPRIVADFPIGL